MWLGKRVQLTHCSYFTWPDMATLEPENRAWYASELLVALISVGMVHINNGAVLGGVEGLKNLLARIIIRQLWVDEVTGLRFGGYHYFLIGLVPSHMAFARVSR